MLRPTRSSRPRVTNDANDRKINDTATPVDNVDPDEIKPDAAENTDDDTLSFHDLGDSSAFVAAMHSTALPSFKKKRKRIGAPMSGCQVILLVLVAVSLVAGVTFVLFTNQLSVISSFRVTTVDSRKLKMVAEDMKINDVSLETIDGHVNIIFSTDCSSHQHWQSYLLYFTAMDINQPGTITRIASGCAGPELQEILHWHRKYIRPMSNNFFIHFTPEFPAPKEGDRRTFNKPFGILHFLQYFEPNDMDGVSDGAAGQGVDLTTEPKDMAFNSTSFVSSHLIQERIINKDVLILLEPDQILLRPITAVMPRAYSAMQRTTTQKDERFVVQPGKPIAQMYATRSGWQSFNLKAIIGSDTSPAFSVTTQEAMENYPAGPPCLGTVEDMYRIAWYWSTFVPKVYSQFPKKLSEMYAYSIAAAHLGLPHNIISTLMISNQAENSEGWSFLEYIPDGDVCAPETIQNWTHISSALDMPQRDMVCPTTLPNCNELRQELPTVLHYCQRYMVQKWFFGKRKYDKYFACESPILETPSIQLGDGYDYRVRPGDRIAARFPIERSESKRSAFMICRMTKALQDAASYFKSQHCKGNPQTNMKEELNLFKLFDDVVYDEK